MGRPDAAPPFAGAASLVARLAGAAPRRHWAVGLVRWSPDGAPRHLAATDAVVGALLDRRRRRRGSPAVLRLAPESWLGMADGRRTVVECAVGALGRAAVAAGDPDGEALWRDRSPMVDNELRSGRLVLVLDGFVDRPDGAAARGASIKEVGAARQRGVLAALQQAEVARVALFAPASGPAADGVARFAGRDLLAEYGCRPHPLEDLAGSSPFTAHHRALLGDDPAGGAQLVVALAAGPLAALAARQPDAALRRHFLGDAAEPSWHVERRLRPLDPRTYRPVGPVPFPVAALFDAAGPPLVLLAPGGSGKTSLLLGLFARWEAARRRGEPAPDPLYVPLDGGPLLRAPLDGRRQLLERLADGLIGGPAPPGAGWDGAALLLDNLDAVEGAPAGLTDALADLLLAPPSGATVVLACRPEAWRADLVAPYPLARQLRAALEAAGGQARVRYAAPEPLTPADVRTYLERAWRTDSRADE